MSRSLSGAGLAAFVCILISGMPTAAHAEDPPEGDTQVPQRLRRPVAVIELGDSVANRKLAEALARELNNHADLKPIDSTIAADAIRDEYKDDDEDEIKDATDARRLAEESVANYKFPEAARLADNGLFRLQDATPSPALVTLSADLAFLLGVGRLGERKDKLAAEAFRYARTIAPTFKPDPIRYLPEVVQAFETAVKTIPPGKGYVEIRTARTETPTGPERVFLDGRDVGAAPQTVPNVTPGMHVVWLVGPERDTHAKRVVVVADRKEPVEFEPASIDLRTKIHRNRLVLKLAPDAAARAAAMQTLARMLEIKDAVLLTAANGKTIVQTWRDGPVDFGTPGFSALREFKDNDKPVELLTPLLPPKPIPPPRKPDPPFKPPVVVDTRSWYEKPRYQIAGGTVGVVIIGVVIYALSSWERSLGLGGAGFETPTSRRGP